MEQWLLYIPWQKALILQLCPAIWLMWIKEKLAYPLNYLGLTRYSSAFYETVWSLLPVKTWNYLQEISIHKQMDNGEDICKVHVGVWVKNLINLLQDFETEGPHTHLVSNGLRAAHWAERRAWSPTTTPSSSIPHSSPWWLLLSCSSDEGGNLSSFMKRTERLIGFAFALAFEHDHYIWMEWIDCTVSDHIGECQHNGLWEGCRELHLSCRKGW